MRIQAENGWRVSEECYLIEEDETEEAEDIEVPKALGDIFESVAGTLLSCSLLSALCSLLSAAPCTSAREYLPRLRPEPGRRVDSVLPDDAGGDRPLLQPRPQVTYQVGYWFSHPWQAQFQIPWCARFPKRVFWVRTFFFYKTEKKFRHQFISIMFAILY